MTKKEIEYFKTKLEKERKVLEAELETVGEVNPDIPGSFTASSGKMEVDNADDNEVADKMEELEENEQIVRQLNTQLKEVVDALGRIDKNTYGLCEVSGDPIETDRLEANPSARTCKTHMNEKVTV